MSPAQKVVTFWGTYDLDKPRVRLLRDGLIACGFQVREINVDVWAGVRDKSQVSGLAAWLRIAWGLARAYPVLLARLARCRPRGVVVIPYMGQLDILVLWPFARLLRVPVILDIFISLYDTLVDDRRMLSSHSPLARAVKYFERLAITRADLSIIDTAAHARRLERLFGLEEQRLGHVLVGAEDTEFAPAEPDPAAPLGKPLRVLFYGQLSPLHGARTILEAARRLDPDAVALTIVGSGQEDALMEEMLAADDLRWVKWLKWIPYAELRGEIARADVCLGVFGASEKAASVIPNKVFQIASVGRHIVTRDGPAIRELFDPEAPGITLVPPADPEALADALLALASRTRDLRSHIFHQDIQPRIGRRAIGRDFAVHIERVANRSRRP